MEVLTSEGKRSMSNTDKLIAVTGATGQQGGATARHLLAKGFKVRALTRDPQKPAAKALVEAGAQVVQADNEDRASLEAAFKGAFGVFSVQSFWEIGTEGEIRQGKNIADAVKVAGVQHIVYSSVGGAERNTGVPHFESKWQIEQHIRQLGLPATILRPVEFMENLNWSRPAILNGSFPSLGLRPQRKRYMIAVDDIGGFATMAFANAQEHIGKATEIAGDALTEQEIARTLSKVIGRPVQLVQPSVTPDQPENDELLKMTRWFDKEGYQSDIPVLKAIYPPLQTLETWLRNTGWENAEPVPMDEAAWSGS
jgi:uncharacterized protein YbjT (DUF2867 family)